MPGFCSILSRLFRRKETPKTGTVPKPKMATPSINARGIELIQHFESCLEPIGNGRYRAYPDPAHGWKVPTIGWGTVGYPDGSKVKRGDVISQQYADELLAWEVGEKSEGVRELVKVKLNDDQFSALVAFSYNVGLGNLKSSTLLRKLNAGDFVGASMEFERWNKANGKTLPGLTRRRLSEQRLFAGAANPIVTYDEFRRMA